MDPFAVAATATFRSCCPAGGSGRCRTDPGPARAPDPFVEFPQRLRIAGEGGIFVERDLELRVGQLFQHAEHIELGFVHPVTFADRYGRLPVLRQAAMNGLIGKWIFETLRETYVCIELWRDWRWAELAQPAGATGLY